MRNIFITGVGSLVLSGLLITQSWAVPSSPTCCAVVDRSAAPPEPSASKPTATSKARSSSPLRPGDRSRLSVTFFVGQPVSLDRSNVSMPKRAIKTSKSRRRG